MVALAGDGVLMMPLPSGLGTIYIYQVETFLLHLSVFSCGICIYCVFVSVFQEDKGHAGWCGWFGGSWSRLLGKGSWLRLIISPR
ncbi:hypothetical protein B0T16DRAFT_35705 [Cercophora newfieldiana]|uniref:Uncharacterized protein n=1 Tax=Cercophora newfieldiana TaxID=92897 RepID=A0AA39YPL8_9PEZI|nr:hypothetical protein B0T16DRAFT_35705 [Cercophora newfieldiana]